MKSLLAPLVMLALIAAAPAPSPTATPDPHVYNDTAMHFEAPADYYALGQQQVDSTKLDGPTVVAVWVKFPRQQNQRTLTISLEPYDGGIDSAGYEVYVENELRGKIDGVFISAKESTRLTNGMPAYFMSVTAGSGFDAQKFYQEVWFDGVRGVTISLAGRLGEITDKEAKDAFENASAVLYPVGRL
jgi:hypothetical protein